MNDLLLALQQKIDNKTKPPGSLGILEKIALQVGLVQDTPAPVIREPHIVVFAGDHGIAATGLVNAYPQSVTAQMVHNFINGGAAINVLTRQYGIGLTVVDAGVNADFDPALPLVHAKIQYGTQNYLNGLAMCADDAIAAVKQGAAITAAIAAKGCNCIGFGEMGIGNTSSASLLMHHYTGLPLADCVGRGTGATDEQLQQKLNTLEDAADYHELARYDITPHSLLCRVGGFEIAMMAGAFVQAARQGMLIVVDGFIATAALLVAIKLYATPSDPTVLVTPPIGLLQYCIFAHASGEQGHRKMLDHLGARPLLQLDMRLGEGTGAAMAIPVIRSAVQLLEEMASFESAGVDGKA